MIDILHAPATHIDVAISNISVSRVRSDNCSTFNWDRAHCGHWLLHGV